MEIAEDNIKRFFSSGSSIVLVVLSRVGNKIDFRPKWPFISDTAREKKNFIYHN